MNAAQDSARYAAHTALDQIGPAGQRRIRNSTVALVGLGGLGCAAAPYLVAAGVRRLHLCDFDSVAESNLARQVLYSPEDVGRAKVSCAAARLAPLNPETGIVTHELRVGDAFIRDQLADASLLIDASDNYGTRLAINRACLAAGKPWVMGACVRLEGQLMFLDPRAAGAPCYRCVYGQAPDGLEDCPGAGVFSGVAAVVGASMAHLALLAAAGIPLDPELHLFDGLRMAWRRMAAEQRPDCPDCGGN